MSGQPVLDENVNINEVDDMFLAFTMVQQILTELSAATEKEKVAVITAAVLGC
jgi:hypothetical protein